EIRRSGCTLSGSRSAEDVGCRRNWPPRQEKFEAGCADHRKSSAGPVPHQVPAARPSNGLRTCSIPIALDRGLELAQNSTESFRMRALDGREKPSAPQDCGIRKPFLLPEGTG